MGISFIKKAAIPLSYQKASRPENDVDVLVAFAPGQTTFRNFMGRVVYLEENFGRRVDLVTEQGLDPLIRQDGESEVVWCEA